MKKVVMIIAYDGFRDEELLDTRKALESKGVMVEVASNKLGMANGKLGAKVKVDLLYSGINTDEFDALVFVGGPGSLQYWDDQTAHKLIQDAQKSDKIIAGICSSVVTLARSSVIKGRRATVFPGDAQELIKCGVNYTAKHLEVDGNLITADGPSAAADFGLEIAKALK